MLLVVDLVDDAVRTASRRVEPSQLTLESTTDSVQVLDEGGEHELDDRGRGALGEALQLPASRTRDA